MISLTISRMADKYLFQVLPARRVWRACPTFGLPAAVLATALAAVLAAGTAGTAGTADIGKDNLAPIR